MSLNLTRPLQAIGIVVGVFLGTLAPGAADAQAFSQEPLRHPTAWPASDLPREAAPLLEWLRQNRGRLESQQRTAGREQVYAVLADRARRHFAATGSDAILPADSTLAGLLAEADRLGVFGAAQLAGRLGEHVHRPNAPPIPEGYELSLDSRAFTLSSEAGRWSLRFPYYFMAWTIDRVTPADRETFDLVSLSTLTAANAPELGGASQATILIVSAGTEDVEKFISAWRGTLAIRPADSTAKTVPNAFRSYARYDPTQRMRIEVTILKIPSGSMLVGYFGLDGTFQANRPHYIDLLSSLRVH